MVSVSAVTACQLPPKPKHTCDDSLLHWHTSILEPLLNATGLKKAEQEKLTKELSQFFLEELRKSSAHMVLKREEAGPIPIGWILQTFVQKNESDKKRYYCPLTGQHFSSYSALMRYVRYAQTHGLSIYKPAYKFVKRRKSLERANTVNKSKKTTSVLSLRRKPSSECSTAKQFVDCEPSTSSSDSDKDQDCVPVSKFLESSDPDSKSLPQKI